MSANEVRSSHLVRRMVCNLQTRGYGALAPDLLDVLANVQKDHPAATEIIRALDQPPQTSMQWPDDETFRSEWVSRRFHGSLRRDRVLMILQALEENNKVALSKSEPLIRFDL